MGRSSTGRAEKCPYGSAAWPAVDFCGSHFSGAVDGSVAGLTEESGGAETMLVCELGQIT